MLHRWENNLCKTLKAEQRPAHSRYSTAVSVIAEATSTGKLSTESGFWQDSGLTLGSDTNSYFLNMFLTLSFSSLSLCKMGTSSTRQSRVNKLVRVQHRDLGGIQQVKIHHLNRHTNFRNNCPKPAWYCEDWLQSPMSQTGFFNSSAYLEASFLQEPQIVPKSLSVYHWHLLVPTKQKFQGFKCPSLNSTTQEPVPYPQGALGTLILEFPLGLRAAASCPSLPSWPPHGRQHLL